MAQISIVYWSGTGNTELMAQKVAEGVREAGQEAVVLSVDLADVSELKKARAFALGCPSMGAEQLEETQMEPFMCDLENGIGGKQIGLFGILRMGRGRMDEGLGRKSPKCRRICCWRRRNYCKRGTG